MCEGTFLGGIAQKIADHLRHGGLHLNDENLLLVPKKNRGTTVGRQDTANLNQRDLCVHVPNLRRARSIDKSLYTTAGFAR